jgi:hypothetical protein
MRFAADENFDGRILDDLRARMPELDIVRVQDTEMYQSPDDKLLGWLAEQGQRWTSFEPSSGYLHQADRCFSLILFSTDEWRNCDNSHKNTFRP